METQQLTLKWRGIFIERCMGRVAHNQKSRIEAGLTVPDGNFQSLWYDNKPLLHSLFEADNWWSVDDVDHTMGLVFDDRSALTAQLATIRYTIDGGLVTVDPDALQLSFYTPEALAPPLDQNERIICHGILRQAVLHLDAEVAPPFDPSLITMSFITTPEHGCILIDLDYDGYDEIRFDWGETTYIKPQLLGKDHFNDASE
jgi:hypothetical protein